MKARNRFVIVAAVVVVMVSSLAATNCGGVAPTSASDPEDISTGGIDAGDILSGKLSNDRLNMGPGSGLDADTLDGLQVDELIQLIQVSEEPTQILQYADGDLSGDDWDTLVEVTGGGYLYTLSSEGGEPTYDKVLPTVRITLDGNQIEFAMYDFRTGGYYFESTEYRSYFLWFAQCNLGVRFNYSLKIEYTPDLPESASLRAIYSTDL